ncbi:MAG TPA: diguanylate cyclase, partial [Spirochaetota bacterium]|nr:diguanylate cyclase [Spirochaetota bacterium]
MNNFILPKGKSISFKIIIGISFIFFVMLLAWAFLFVTNQRKFLIQQLNYRDSIITKAAAIFCAPALLMEDYVILQDYIEKISEVDKNILIAEIQRKDEKVIAKFISQRYSQENKKNLKFYISSIKSKEPSNEVVGQFIIGLSTKDSEKIIFINILGFFIVSILFLAFLAIIIGLFINRIIIAPIKKLDGFARRISDGELYFKIELKNRDEFGYLSLTMDNMRNSLIDYYEKINNYNEDLEEMVEIRTKDLTQTNEKLEKSYEDLLESQSKNIYLAFHDDLTGLTNRRSLKDKLENIVDKANNSNERLAVLFISLDNFKSINDKFGIITGDEILKETAKRMLNITNDIGEVARWGGDQFIIILTQINDKDETIIITKKLLDIINTPFSINSKEINLTASIGISFFPDDDKDGESLINKSIFALYEAKKDGKNRFNIFDKDRFDKSLHNIAILEELKKSVENKEFILYYQPKVNGDGEIVDLEALIRWNSNKYGFVPPDDFIPIAEYSDIIIDIGNWVLKSACECIVKSQEMGYIPFKIAVNLSSRHFQYSKLIDVIKTTLEETKCDPLFLEIEITETSAMDRLD